ncbi:hypothetical protein KKF32_04695 [Patescibacteria group bacterium]|nr:hypothetical protein [Patescibacteria group bacterium]
MNDEFDNINLLPEELRKEEERQKQVAKRKEEGSDSASVDFYIPPTTPEEKPKPEKAAKPEPEPQENKQPPKIEEKPRPKTKPVVVSVTKIKKDKDHRPKKSFLSRFFKTKPKKKDSLAEPISKVKPKESSESSPVISLQESATLSAGKKVEEGSHGGSIDVNLIPEGTYLLSTKKVFYSLGTAVLIGVLLIFLSYLGLIFYGNYVYSQDKKLSLTLQQKEKDFNQYKSLEKKAFLWSKKVETVKKLAQQHVYWTKFFTKLESLTIPDVYYTTFAATTNGTITLAATATDYTAVAKQLIVLQEAEGDVFENVEIGNMSGDSSGGQVNFNIVLKLNPQVFSNPFDS